ncbi:DUF1837 domain-containing protein [uncultured Brachyspira sp.]|uniref:HamA C-terminal domain-containing protein n=1 Tax=uncultured Brachyspira sp. TaxID=221953 RepID=UPI0025F6E723|nr:DUF1837 domain-containing protein [uncultured Brachyspira sp.]
MKNKYNEITKTNYDNIKFDILVDDILKNLNLNIDACYKNYCLLSLINDYENGQWRINKFVDYLYDRVIEVGLSFEERKILSDYPMSMLKKAISKLKPNDIEKSGEIGEILLYAIMKDYYNALNVVPKIFYKTNRNTYIHGADSIHITINNGQINLWLGESKFYKDVKKAVKNAIESIKSILEDDKLKAEISMAYNSKDLNDMLSFNKIDKNIHENIKLMLDNANSLDKVKKQLHIPILILYECDITLSNNSIDDNYKTNIISCHKKIVKECFLASFDFIKNLYKGEEINFHLILFPVHSKKDISEIFFRKLLELEEKI